MPTPRPDQLDRARSRRPNFHFAGTPSHRPSPLQNRVLPTGDIVADPARGMLMGNRGCIHDLDRRLGVTRWRSRMWISCVLKWGNIRRDVMPPGRWTALFFLDEATALSAGHRPCGYCRRNDHLAFGEAWRRAAGLTTRLKASEMDVVLHGQRVDRTRHKLTVPATLAELPDGAMVQHGGEPALVLNGGLRPWSLTGYGPALEIAPSTSLAVLTPPAILGALEQGYRPLIHPSAGPTRLRTIR